MCSWIGKITAKMPIITKVINRLNINNVPIPFFTEIEKTILNFKAMLKILQARLQQYKNHELPDVQTGFRKGRGTRDQIANIRWIIKKQEISRKTSTSALLTTLKPLTV